MQRHLFFYSNCVYSRGWGAHPNCISLFIFGINTKSRFFFLWSNSVTFTLLSNQLIFLHFLFMCRFCFTPKKIQLFSLRARCGASHLNVFEYFSCLSFFLLLLFLLPYVARTQSHSLKHIRRLLLLLRHCVCVLINTVPMETVFPLPFPTFDSWINRRRIGTHTTGSVTDWITHIDVSSKHFVFFLVKLKIVMKVWDLFQKILWYSFESIVKRKI